MIDTFVISPAVRLYVCGIEPAASRREAERCAVGRLLAEALPGAVLSHTADGAPCVAGNGVCVSVSHSRVRAALAVSLDGTPVGVDVETWRGQLEKVAPRVLSREEIAAYGSTREGLLRAWTLKEALYKAALTPGLDFRRDVRLPLGDKKNEATVATPGGIAKCFAVLLSRAEGGEGIALVTASSAGQSLVP